MFDLKNVDLAVRIIEELSATIRQMSDTELSELTQSGAFDHLLKAIFDTSKKGEYPSLNDFILANKTRAVLIAVLRRVITLNYALPGINKEGQALFIAASEVQWFDDGVMFYQGERPFEGLIGLYRQDKRLSYATLIRDARSGETLTPEHFQFIDEAEYRERVNQIPKLSISDLDKPILELQALFNAKDNDESKYQELFEKYPWLLGAEHKDIQRHLYLDDRNIPDFTGVRVRDACRDIIEIKPPFTKMFREAGELNAEFNDAWFQAERYLDFARKEGDYLYRKGLRFDNPKCYLILGFNLTDEEMKQARIKERMNPAIHFLTYNELMEFAKNTVSLIRTLHDQDKLLKSNSQS